MDAFPTSILPVWDIPRIGVMEAHIGVMEGSPMCTTVSTSPSEQSIPGTPTFDTSTSVAYNPTPYFIPEDPMEYFSQGMRLLEEGYCSPAFVHKTTPKPETMLVQDDNDGKDETGMSPKELTPELPNSPQVTKLNTLPISPKTSSSKRHRPPTTYACPQHGCQKTFTRPYNLKSHILTHEGEKPFKCAKCDKAFARLHDRNRHYKLHLGIRPYVCDYCDKAFARHDAWKKHILPHGGCRSRRRSH
ncbi:hypothetical protein BZG36_02174 [Bifiguratus adelaidae]|uniref:C2H2-type domain-containing protein n=1 Tax=Bifiguratus adelaidae TaxID=1938954 RepID=A0A261Y0L7_9FUNG|nr:hypothetical protein BZG36_02174 [Bifiguratus adelaidae]